MPFRKSRIVEQKVLSRESLKGCRWFFITDVDIYRYFVYLSLKGKSDHVIADIQFARWQILYAFNSFAVYVTMLQVALIIRLWRRIFGGGG